MNGAAGWRQPVGRGHCQWRSPRCFQTNLLATFPSSNVLVGAWETASVRPVFSWHMLYRHREPVGLIAAHAKTISL
ncbi:MAG: hypothetical protein KatS3mg105_1536 [Gemmatales bacterium]|nr:MAG: hypothetical protein KatS3mg105_1536 [Gemmatales bacterium]